MGDTLCRGWRGMHCATGVRGDHAVPPVEGLQRDTEGVRAVTRAGEVQGTGRAMDGWRGQWEAAVTRLEGDARESAVPWVEGTVVGSPVQWVERAAVGFPVSLVEGAPWGAPMQSVGRETCMGTHSGFHE